jgi:type II protein arginine methyltransferase
MCLFDERRVEHFRRAILDTVRPGDIVVDAGSGTGLLGMFAAVAGAARVYCVEISPGYIGVIEENARRNGLDDRIVVIHADATTVVLPEDVDVIVCEVLSAGLFYEPQLQIIENLRAFLRSGGSIIPSSVEKLRRSGTRPGHVIRPQVRLRAALEDPR